MLIPSHLQLEPSNSRTRVPAGGIDLIASIDFKSDGATTATLSSSTKVSQGDDAISRAQVATPNHSNQQYSIYAITDAAANIAERYAYTAYGQPTILNASATVIATSAISNRYTYTAREWDATVVLYHFRARWMSGLTGRFLTRDPIGYAAGANLLELLGSSPINYIDPMGDFQSKEECNRAIRLRKTPEKNGVSWPYKCPIPDVVCEKCDTPGRGGHAGQPNGNKHNPAFITICWNTATERTIDQVLKHEFVHAADYCVCSKKILTDEFWESEEDFRGDIACLEIRAYSLDGGCDNKPTDEERKDCIKKGAARSVADSLGISIEEARNIIEGVFAQCYLDKPKKRPFTVPDWPRPKD